MLAVFGDFMNLGNSDESTNDSERVRLGAEVVDRKFDKITEVFMRDLDSFELQEVSGGVRLLEYVCESGISAMGAFAGRRIGQGVGALVGSLGGPAGALVGIGAGGAAGAFVGGWAGSTLAESVCTP